MPEIGPRQGQFRVDGLQEPFERFAVEPLPELHPARDVAVVLVPYPRSLFVVVLLVLVHPHLQQTHVVLGERVANAPREGVGVAGSEDVPHVGAGDDFQLPPTHPDLPEAKDTRLRHLKTVYPQQTKTSQSYALRF